VATGAWLDACPPALRQAAGERRLPERRTGPAPDHRLSATPARVRAPEIRLAARAELAAPITAAFRPWREAQLARIPRSSKLAEDIRCTLGIWPGLMRFLKDGRLELDTNPIENQIRPIALPRKNALFASHEVGARNWAMLASLIATCKLSDANPVDCITRTLRAILDGHPARRIQDLMPWSFEQRSSLAA